MSQEALCNETFHVPIPLLKMLGGEQHSLAPYHFSIHRHNVNVFLRRLIGDLDPILIKYQFSFWGEWPRDPSIGFD